MRTTIHWGSTAHTVMVEDPTAWAINLLDALHEGYGLIVEHQDDATRVVITGATPITVNDLTRSLSRHGCVDLEVIRRGPKPKEPARRDPSTCPRCGGSTSQHGRPCDEC